MNVNISMHKLLFFRVLRTLPPGEIFFFSALCDVIKGNISMRERTVKSWGSSATKFLWDFHIQADKLVMDNQPDIIVIK